MITFKQFMEADEDLDDMTAHDFTLDWRLLTRELTKTLAAESGIKLQDVARNPHDRLVVSFVEEGEVFIMHGYVDPKKPKDIDFTIVVARDKDHEGGWHFDFDKYLGKEEALARELAEEVDSWTGSYFAYRDDPDIGD